MAGSVASRLNALSASAPFPLNWQTRSFETTTPPGIHRTADTVVVVGRAGVIFSVDARGNAAIDAGVPDLVDLQQVHDKASLIGHLLNDRLVLHGSAVTNGSQALAVLGAAGAGKSTTAAQLIQRGMSLLADDVTVLGLADDRPKVLAQDTHLRLLTANGSKRVVPAPTSPGNVPLHVLVVLMIDSSAAEVRSERLSDMAALEAVRYHGGGQRSLHVLGPTRYFCMLTRLADRCEVWRIQRPAEGGSVDEVADAVAGLLGTSAHRSRQH